MAHPGTALNTDWLYAMISRGDVSIGVERKGKQHERPMAIRRASNFTEKLRMPWGQARGRTAS